MPVADTVTDVLGSAVPVLDRVSVGDGLCVVDGVDAALFDPVTLNVGLDEGDPDCVQLGVGEAVAVLVDELDAEALEEPDCELVIVMLPEGLTVDVDVPELVPEAEPLDVADTVTVLVADGVIPEVGEADRVDVTVTLKLTVLVADTDRVLVGVTLTLVVLVAVTLTLVVLVADSDSVTVWLTLTVTVLVAVNVEVAVLDVVTVTVELELVVTLPDAETVTVLVTVGLSVTLADTVTERVGETELVLDTD